MQKKYGEMPMSTLQNTQKLIKIDFRTIFLYLPFLFLSGVCIGIAIMLAIKG